MKKTLIIAMLLLFTSYSFSQQKGCVSGDCDNGYGTYAYSNGDKYTGDWVNQKMHGNGAYYYKNGNIYKGQFKHNKLEGIGTVVFYTGAKYTGNYLNNKANGEGTYFHKNGKVEKGLWINGVFAGKNSNKKKGCISGDCKNGFGTYIFPNGEKYIGNTKNMKRNGQGTYFFTSGEWYNGTWKNNIRHGQGVNYFADGEKYDGQWIDGYRHGYGTHYYVDGTKKSGMWENNRYVGTGKNNYGCISGNCIDGYGVYRWKQGEFYVGEWKNNKRNGQGRNVWANGETYEGNWLNDKRNNYGIQTFPKKENQKGFWKEDKFISKNAAKSGCVAGNCNNGYGTYIFKDGKSYKGVFKNKLFDGRGTFTSTSGSTYNGEFRSGKFHGQGTKTVVGKGRYVGDFKNGLYNGLGTFYYDDGRIKSGKWKNNKFAGTAQTNLKAPKISWISPKISNSELKKSEVEIKLCINSKEHPQNIQVFVNDKLQMNNVVRGLKVVKSNCNFTFVRTVSLKPGDNNIKVVVTNGAGTSTSETKNIKYNSEQNKKYKRYALVIGNSTYEQAPLKNPTNDAKAIAATLKSKGFDVAVFYNQTQEQMKKSISDFGTKITESKGVGLFFYAGHGLQVFGENYLVPVDAHISKYQDIEEEAVNLNRLTGEMSYAKNDINIIILDACRNNPFEGDPEGGQGLASAPAPAGSFLAFATAPGSVAADGSGDNGLYTQELLKALNTDNWVIEDVFKEVRRKVYKISNKQQTPWENSSIFDDFYFSKK